MDNSAFYDRIKNGQETEEDVKKFYSMCQDYSDIYKDTYGFRPRSSDCMCVNGYSGHPDIEKFRELLRNDINPLAEVYDRDDEADNDYMDDWMEECADHDFMNSNVSKEQILDRHPEYEQYFEPDTSETTGSPNNSDEPDHTEESEWDDYEEMFESVYRESFPDYNSFELHQRKSDKKVTVEVDSKTAIDLIDYIEQLMQNEEDYKDTAERFPGIVEFYHKLRKEFM